MWNSGVKGEQVNKLFYKIYLSFCVSYGVHMKKVECQNSAFVKSLLDTTKFDEGVDPEICSMVGRRLAGK